MKDLSILTSILEQQVVPALGCTEPVAVAYCASMARSIVKGEIRKIEVEISRNVFKNAMGVGIPNSHHRGVDIAAALGACSGNPELKLEVLKNIGQDDEEKALKLVEKELVDVKLSNDTASVYIEVKIITDTGYGRCIIKGSHTNVVLLENQDGIIFRSEENATVGSNKNINSSKIREYKLSDFREYVDSVSLDDIYFIKKGIELNRKIAEEGLKKGLGAKVGLGILRLINKGIVKDDIVNYAKMITAAGADARMSGYNMPVMSSAGSGNHGLVTFLPVVAVGEKLGIDEEKVIRAVALSNLVTIYIKEFTGKLSSVCGCGVAAAIGASVGIVYLLGGDDEAIQRAVKNMIADITGMICDGGKEGCAIKLSTSVGAAVECALMALEGIEIPYVDGILKKTAEESIESLGKISVEGMKNADEVILEIMLSKIS